MMRNVDWKDSAAIDTIEQVIQKGGVVVGDSDTVAGLLAAATRQGKDALDGIKQRSAMPYLLLVKDIEHAQQYSDAFAGTKVQELARAFWPGPLTLIVVARKDVPEYMKSLKGGIAIRVPDHAGLQQLLSRCGALFSTSANLSGQPVPETVSAIDPAIAQHVDFVIGDTEKKEGVPSTILDCTTDPISVVREGALSKERLGEYL